jgi:hypothetical protein
MAWFGSILPPGLMSRSFGHSHPGRPLPTNPLCRQGNGSRLSGSHLRGTARLRPSARLLQSASGGGIRLRHWMSFGDQRCARIARRRADPLRGLEQPGLDPRRPIVDQINGRLGKPVQRRGREDRAAQSESDGGYFSMGSVRAALGLSSFLPAKGMQVQLRLGGPLSLAPLPQRSMTCQASWRSCRCWHAEQRHG